MALPLPIRNRLAELIVDAFDHAEARATLRALSRACAGPGDSVPPEEAGRLAALGWFEAPAPGRPRLLAAHRRHGAELADRARRGVRATGAGRALQGEPIARLLGRAQALAAERLYFETHELLEPAWFRAEEPLRTALQGLIQVAVAFHHLEHGNGAGARSLLAEGREKLAATAGVLPLDTGSWLRELGGAQEALERGEAGGAVPRWPEPVAVRPT